MRPSVGAEAPGRSGFRASARSQGICAYVTLRVSGIRNCCVVSLHSDHCGPTCGRPHRRGGRRHDDVRAWCVTKTGGTLGWLGCRAFGLSELRAETAGARCEGLGRREIFESLNYNNQQGYGPPWGISCPPRGAARCGLVPWPPCLQQKHAGITNVFVPRHLAVTEVCGQKNADKNRVSKPWCKILSPIKLCG